MAFYDNLEESGIGQDIKYTPLPEFSELFTAQEDKGLADTTILHYHRLISTILNTTVHWQVLLSNPCQRVKPPKVKRKEARYLDEIQEAQLLECVQKEPYQYNVIVQLLLYTGMRLGELCGIEWQDVDFLTNCLHIWRSSLYILEKGVFEDEPKNEHQSELLSCQPVPCSFSKTIRHGRSSKRLCLVRHGSSQTGYLQHGTASRSTRTQ